MMREQSWFGHSTHRFLALTNSVIPIVDLAAGRAPRVRMKPGALA
jgi:hypothetical protein